MLSRKTRCVEFPVPVKVIFTPYTYWPEDDRIRAAGSTLVFNTVCSELHVFTWATHDVLESICVMGTCQLALTNGYGEIGGFAQLALLVSGNILWSDIRSMNTWADTGCVGEASGVLIAIEPASLFGGDSNAQSKVFSKIPEELPIELCVRLNWTLPDPGVRVTLGEKLLESPWSPENFQPWANGSEEKPVVGSNCRFLVSLDPSLK